MVLLDALRSMVSGKTATAGRLRCARRRGRRVMTVLLGPVVAAASSFVSVPVALTAVAAAGITASAVAGAGPAKAVSGPPVLVVLVNVRARHQKRRC